MGRVCGGLDESLARCPIGIRKFRGRYKGVRSKRWSRRQREVEDRCGERRKTMGLERRE